VTLSINGKRILGQNNLDYIQLCQLDDIGESDSKGFTVTIKGKQENIFVVRKKAQIYAYKNSCPHTQAPLDWRPDEFLDEDKKTIICALHGATFSIEDGRCLQGPCNGRGLQSVTVKVSEETIYLKII